MRLFLMAQHLVFWKQEPEIFQDFYSLSCFGWAWNPVLRGENRAQVWLLGIVDFPDDSEKDPRTMVVTMVWTVGTSLATEVAEKICYMSGAAGGKQWRKF